MTPLHRLPLFYFAYSFVLLLIDDTSFSCHTRPLRLWGDPLQSRADWFLWMTIYYKLWSVHYKYLVVAMVLPQLVLRFTLAISLSSFPLIFCLSWAHTLIWTSNHWQSLTLAPPVHPLTHVELIRTLQGLDSQEVGWWQQKWRREMRTEREWVVERMGRSVTDAPKDAYYTVMTMVVSSNESWTDSVSNTGLTWSRSYCCTSSHWRLPRNPVLGWLIPSIAVVGFWIQAPL